MPSTVNAREMRASDFRVGVCDQTVKDELNATPTFVPVRRTEGVPWRNVTYVEDPSVNGLMQGKEQIKESESIAMELQSVATKQSVKMLVEAIHADTTSLGVTGTNISFTATGIESASDAFTNFFVGQCVWATGTTGGLNNMAFVITAKPDNGEITTSPPPSAVQAAGPSVVLTSHVSHNRDLPTYIMAQLRATDLSQPDDINYYTAYNGICNTYSAEVPEGGLWSVTANYLFELEYASNPSAISGQTYAAAPTDKALSSAKNAPAGIRSFYVDNIVQTCTIKNLSFEVNNNYQEDPFASCPTGFYRGDFQVTGSFVAKALTINPFVWRDKSYNSTNFTIAFRFAHSTTEESYIIFHKNIATEAPMPNGSSSVAHTEVTFSAEEKTDIATTVTVCRNWTT